MKWSLISAVNNEAVLEQTLLKSPDIASATEMRLQRKFRSAACAYNAAIDQAQTDVLVMLHQDVYLPPGWLKNLEHTLEILSVKDPKWAVLGIWGVTNSSKEAGHLYCTGNMRILGKPFRDAVEVNSLDEALLILRRSSGLRFDERLQGFHFYGTDICLEARRRGMKCYAISAFCVHNTNGYNLLPFQFWLNYFFMRRKWKSLLPISTSCTKITFWCWPMIWWNVNRAAHLMLGRHKAGTRAQNPSQLDQQIASSGQI